MKDKIKILGKEWSRKVLDKLMEEAIVDCHDEDEAFMGIFCTLQDQLEFSFKAKVMGEIVDIIDMDDRSNEKKGIFVKIVKEKKKYLVALSTVELVKPVNKKNEKWIAMYKYWSDDY